MNVNAIVHDVRAALGLHSYNPALLGSILYLYAPDGLPRAGLKAVYGMSASSAVSGFVRLRDDPSQPAAEMDKRGRYVLTTWARERCTVAIFRRQNPNIDVEVVHG